MEMERAYKMLIVDDDAAFREMLYRFFQEQGFIVETAADTETALEKLRDGEFDVALTEVQLPSLGGLAMIKQVKKEGIDTSFIIITGQGSRTDAIHAIKVGVDDWFDKSALDLDILKESVIRAAQILSLDEIQQILSGIPD